MIGAQPAQIWWTADEIAAAVLPDMPATKRGVNKLADRGQWQAQPALARRRGGKGGGWEYSWQLFSDAAQRKLQAAVGKTTANPAVFSERDAVWTWYDSLPQSVKDKACARLGLIQQVEALTPLDGRQAAILSVAQLSGVSLRTLTRWLALIVGVRADDRLAYLAPRNRAESKPARHKDSDPEFLSLIKSDYLRLEYPPFSDCYRRAVRVAKAKGWDVLPARTMQRRLDATVSRASQILARKGIEALKRLYPSQVRDKTALVAMEAVNGDFHKFDVFVSWPSPNGEPAQIIRPQMCAFQDIYSGRILAWRMDVTPNSTAVQLCAGDMIETYGIPEHILLDNGREFAAKAITGGAATRYRFKVQEDDIPGLFTGLGCKIHWATPYSGQSKPIERAFRDLCSTISKDPRFAGAWTGNRPDAKPENYGKTAIALEQFLAVVGEGIQEHNSRQDRRCEVAFGRSFADVFDESYAVAPIRKATEAQRRLWLLGAQGLRADTDSGRIKFQGNEFWEPWMTEIAGSRVIIRFDPADLWSGLHIYSADNAYLGHAQCLVKAGFFDMEEGRMHARARSAYRKAELAALEAHRKLSTTEIAAYLNDIAPAPSTAIEARVVKPVFGKGKGLPPAAQPKPGHSDAEVHAVQSAMVADLAAHRSAAPLAPEETEKERFRRALDIEQRLSAGEAVTRDQDRWLRAYQTTANYIAQRMFWDDLGDAYFG